MAITMNPHTAYGVIQTTLSANGNVSSQIVSPSQNESANCMERLIRWLRNDENSLLLRIGAVALMVVGTLGAAALLAGGISLLAGHTLLVFATVFIPAALVLIGAIVWGCITSSRLSEEEAVAAREAVLIREHTEQAREALTRVQEVVGGEEAFNQFPVLNIGNRTGATGYLDFIEPNDLEEPVMRGIDATGRSFISLRLRTNDQDQPFVVTFFQRFQVGVAFNPRWTWGSTVLGPTANLLNETFRNVLEAEGLEAIRQIVVGRNHPELRLV